MLRIAKVSKVHPEANSVDIVYLHNLARVPMVQVMGDVDSVYLPEPTPAPGGAGDITPTKQRDIYAVVCTVFRKPIVLGFLKPQICQVLFKGRPNFRVHDHASGVYSTLDDAGNYTHAWPNGTYLKVGADPAKEDLTGQDFDAQWKRTRNLTAETHVQLVVMNAGVQTALVHITPAGAVTITAAGAIASSAPSWAHTGDIAITGDVSATGTITGTTDVVGGGKHLKTHTHSDPQGGSTGAPT